MNYFLLFLLVLSLHILGLLVVVPESWQKLNDKSLRPKEEVFRINLDQWKSRSVVETTRSAHQKKTENAFAGDRDNYFDKQTLAPKVGSFAELGKRGVRRQKKLKLADFGLNSNDFKSVSANSAEEEQAGETSAPNQGNGENQSYDYVPGIDRGAMARLNTVESKNYGYFLRIKKQIEGFWGASIETIVRQYFIAQDKRVFLTHLEVTMNAKGELLQVTIFNPSGREQLDNAAVNAFRRAGPFPNPPKDLIENGIVKIKWSFMVDIK